MSTLTKAESRQYIDKFLNSEDITINSSNFHTKQVKDYVSLVYNALMGTSVLIVTQAPKELRYISDTVSSLALHLNSSDFCLREFGFSLKMLEKVTSVILLSKAFIQSAEPYTYP